MSFKHPLARDAKVWSTAGLKGKSRSVLVIITTLELVADHKKYKADKVKALSDAAEAWVVEHPADAVDYMLINRAKDWVGGAD